jgi:hypothetical protein
MILAVRENDGRILAAGEDLDGLAFDGCAIVPAPEGWDPSFAYLVDGVLGCDLDKAKEVKAAEIVATRAELLATTATSFGTFYTDDRTLMLGQLVGILLLERAGAPLPATVGFKTVEGWQTFAREDFVAAGLQVLGRFQNLFSAQSTIEAQIETAASVEDLDAIAWPNV